MVFQAVDVANGKDVALKIMQPAFAKNEDDMHRFVRSVKTMQPLRTKTWSHCTARERAAPIAGCRWNG